ncbi:MAG: hypothetical protein DRG24_06215 [Epsilonproteobacteria bacterium]|nr:MAG: hypothetical protein DRG24_06215 [Campylobacterota bacterium]
MNLRLILALILIIDAALLLFETSTFSITYNGARLLYEESSLLQVIVNSSLQFFGQNDYALRFPMIVMHLLSTVLLYKIAKPYARYPQDRMWLILIFLLLPGVNSAALLVDNAGLVIVLLFIYAYLYQKHPKYADAILLLYLWIDSAFIFLFMGRFFHAMALKQKWSAILTIVLVVMSFYLFGYDSGGTPKGHFLDTLGLYAAIFTPIVFIYLFYTLYRRYVAEQEDLLWYIAATSLIVSLLLSFRQQIHIENFAPFLMLALPLGMQTFYRSYRVRLKQFRGNYQMLFMIAFSLLIINALVVLFNKEIYRFLENPKKHFAYRAHIAKELAAELKKKNIDCVHVKNEHRMQLRLHFYGIDFCQDNILQYDQGTYGDSVTVSYRNRQLARYSVSKLHN